jgi:hypothetical protein
MVAHDGRSGSEGGKGVLYACGVEADRTEFELWRRAHFGPSLLSAAVGFPIQSHFVDQPDLPLLPCHTLSLVIPLPGRPTNTFCRRCDPSSRPSVH